MENAQDRKTLCRWYGERQLTARNPSPAGGVCGRVILKMSMHALLDVRQRCTCTSGGQQTGRGGKQHRVCTCKCSTILITMCNCSIRGFTWRDGMRNAECQVPVVRTCGSLHGPS